MDWLFLIAKDEDGYYLTETDGVKSCNPEKAWHYQSSVIFADAEDAGCKVYLRLYSGKEIEVSLQDCFPVL